MMETGRGLNRYRIENVCIVIVFNRRDSSVLKNTQPRRIFFS